MACVWSLTKCDSPPLWHTPRLDHPACQSRHCLLGAVPSFEQPYSCVRGMQQRIGRRLAKHRRSCQRFFVSVFQFGRPVHDQGKGRGGVCSKGVDKERATVHLRGQLWEKASHALHIIAVLIAESLDQVLLFDSCPQSEKHKHRRPRRWDEPRSQCKTKA